MTAVQPGPCRRRTGTVGDYCSSSVSQLTPANVSALEAVTEKLFKETFVPVTQLFKVTSAVLDQEWLRNDERIRETIYTS